MRGFPCPGDERRNTSIMNGYHGTFEMVDPKKLVVDHRFQRPEKNTLIQQIAQSPSWEAFGVPVCFKRANDMLYVADGQQRVRGILASNNPPLRVPIVWFPMEGVEDEAEVFVKINEWRKQLLPIEKHKAKVVAKDPAALGVSRAVEKAGFSIGYGTTHSESPRTIQAIAALNAIYNNLGEDGVVQTLTVLREAWPDDGAAISTHVMRGVAELVMEKGDDYNRAKMVTALKRTSPSAVLREADKMRFDFGGSKLANVRRAFKSLAKI